MPLDASLEISWLAVVVGTIGYQALGALWYGPLFGSRWMTAMGYDSADDVPEHDTPTAGYLATAVGSLVALAGAGVLLAVL